MSLGLIDLAIAAAPVFAILMAGSRHLRVNLWLYALQTFAIALAAYCLGQELAEPALVYTALAVFVLKAVIVPMFLHWIVGRVKVTSDPGTIMRAPLAMHLSILLLGVSFLLAQQLPNALTGHGQIGAAAAVSLLLTGIILMLTRKIALSQIVGFLVIENGIFVFALTQTVGMPMAVELGILLDVLVAVMIAGLLVFRIKQSFEHIDVAQLADLKD